MNCQQVNETQWQYTGHHTTGTINQVRDGIVIRYVAQNSNRKTSRYLSSIESAEKWLKQNDTRG